MALTGTFDDITFAELLQMLNVGNKTGKLTVSRSGDEAVLHLVNGNVARAVSRLGKGPEVVYRVLGWSAGDFCFERSDEPVMHNISDTTEGLILEGMKRFDEWQQVETEMPDNESVLRQKAYAVNEQFENLSAEAQIVLRLVDARRNLATIIRESGLAPSDAVRAVAELRSSGIVEEWSGSGQIGDVALTAGRLPEASGAIDFSSAAYFSKKERSFDGRATALSADRRDPADSDRESGTES
jgi:hypothetical protein